MRPKKLVPKAPERPIETMTTGNIQKAQAPAPRPKPRQEVPVQKPTQQGTSRVISQETYAPKKAGSMSMDDYVASYLADLKDLRAQIDAQLEPGDTPNPEDMQKIIQMILQQSDDEFMIGLAVLIFRMEIEAGKETNIIKRIIYDLEDGDDWFDLGDWD